jgi:hypothetical protein
MSYQENLVDLSTIVSLFCAGSAAIQALAAILYIWDWKIKSKTSKAQMAVGKKIFTFVLAIGALVMVGFSVWLYDHPLKPIEKTVYVDKPASCPTCPVCPAIKTGPATAKAGPGGVAIGHSGNGDTLTLPSSTSPQK